MALSVTSYKKVNQIVNQNIPCKYYAPKTEEEQKALTVDTNTMSINELKEYYINLGQEIDGIGWVSLIPQHFNCAEGTEDVYKKSGFEMSLDEIMGRQEYASMRWRIITDCSYIDFEPNGAVEIGGQVFKILDIIYAFSTGTSPNKLKFYKKGTLSFDYYKKMSPKLIVLG